MHYNFTFLIFILPEIDFKINVQTRFERCPVLSMNWSAVLVVIKLSWFSSFAELKSWMKWIVSSFFVQNYMFNLSNFTTASYCTAAAVTFLLYGTWGMALAAHSLFFIFGAYMLMLYITLLFYTSFVYPVSQTGKLFVEKNWE